MPKDQLRFATILAVVALALALLILGHRSPVLDIAQPVAAVSKQLGVQHRNHARSSLEEQCRRTDCSCAEVAAGAGLDVDDGANALRILAAAHDCAPATLLDGLRAEALVRSGSVAEGLARATASLDASQRSPYAWCARAVASLGQRSLASTSEQAKKALADGRGDGARMVLGLAAFYAGDLKAARLAFQDILKSEPEDVGALYDLALVAQKQDRYGEARRLYVTVLRLQPTNKPARYNLALLVHSAGATAEATHQLEMLAAQAPGDPLVARLAVALATPPSHSREQILSLGGAGTPSPTPTAAPAAADATASP